MVCVRTFTTRLLKAGNKYMNEFSLTHTAMELLCIDEDIRFRFKDRNTRISDFLVLAELADKQ